MGGVTSAWELARAAADAAGVSVTPLTTLPEAEEVSALAGELWEDGALSAAIARAFQLAGSGLLGARAEGHLVGFVAGFLGLQDGLHVHSHMLGVVPGSQSRGIGYALKLAQRAAALEAGVGEVRWTYDPLVARNAWFNLVKLGAVATDLLMGFYGEMTDRLNAGDRSDRFEVRWQLESPRVDRALHGRAEPPSAGSVLLEAVGERERPRPVSSAERPTSGAVIAIPLDHFALRTQDAELGRAWREASAAAFRSCFDAGLVASWIDRAGRYVFQRPQEALA